MASLNQQKNEQTAAAVGRQYCRVGKTEQDDGTGSYAQPPVAYEFSDHHKPHNPSGPEPTHPVHLPTGPAVNLHAVPVNNSDDATGSYGQPPTTVGLDDRHKAHVP